MIVKNNKKIKEDYKKEPLSKLDILSTLDNIRDLINEFNLDRYYMILAQYDINYSKINDDFNIIFQMECIIDKLKILKDLFHNKLIEMK